MDKQANLSLNENSYIAYAKWNHISIEMSFNSMGGSEVPSIMIEYNNTIAVDDLPVPTKDGYEFGGWVTSENGSELLTSRMHWKEPHTFYASWIPEQYAMTFDGNGGQVRYIMCPSNGQTMFNWETMCVEGRVLDEMPIMHDDGEDSLTVMKGFGLEVEPPPVAREGYNFCGWDPLIPTLMPDRDIACQAIWFSDAQCAIVWNGNGGTPNRNYDICEVGTTIRTYPIATRPGCEFMGWFTQPTEGTQLPSILTVQQSATYYAQWKLLPYAITYDMNGHGYMPDDALTEYTVETETYYPPRPRKTDNYMFVSWVPKCIPQGATGDMTFTAVWAEYAPLPSNTKATITYYDNNSLIPENYRPSPKTVEIGTEVMLPLI